MSNRPDPLTPANCDLRDMEWFPLYRRRLLNSEFWTTASDLARSRSVDLWCEAMDQIPAGSLPNNPMFLAQKASYGRDVDAWRTSADEIMSPWVLCSDGRFYHPVLCEVALEVWERKVKNESDKQADARRKREARAAKKAKRDKEKVRQQELDLDHGGDASGGRPPEVRSITDTNTRHNPLSYASHIRERGDADASPPPADFDADVDELFGKPDAPSKPKATAKPKAARKPNASGERPAHIAEDWAPAEDWIARRVDALGLDAWEIRAALPEFVAHWRDRTDAKARKTQRGWLSAFDNNLARIASHPSLRHALKTSDLAPAHTRLTPPNGVGHAHRRDTGFAAAEALRLLGHGPQRGDADARGAGERGGDRPLIAGPAR